MSLPGEKKSIIFSQQHSE
uniref:Uncharacterized protein n=1 Tax=Anguilla anguilla TaxID=7936 RepID=A0A0E9QAX4_ANGAN